MPRKKRIHPLSSETDHPDPLPADADEFCFEGQNASEIELVADLKVSFFTKTMIVTKHPRCCCPL